MTRNGHTYPCPDCEREECDGGGCIAVVRLDGYYGDMTKQCPRSVACHWCGDIFETKSGTKTFCNKRCAEKMSREKAAIARELVNHAAERGNNEREQ